MDINQVLDNLSSIFQITGVSLVSIIAFLLSILSTRNKMKYSETREKVITIVKYIFKLLGTACVIFIVFIITLADSISKYDTEWLSNYKVETLQISLLLFIISLFYAMVLAPLWYANNKYYEVYLKNEGTKVLKYKMIGRIKEKHEDILIYQDEKGVYYEEDVSTIKNREGRLSYKPCYKTLLDIIRENYDALKNVPMYVRWIFFILLLISEITILIVCIRLIVNIWTTNFSIPLILFKISLSSMPLLVIVYMTWIFINFYIKGLGKNKVLYEKS